MSFREKLALKFEIASELMDFFWKHKWWWLTPVILVFVLFGILTVMSQGTIIAPLIYVLF